MREFSDHVKFLQVKMIKLDPEIRAFNVQVRDGEGTYPRRLYAQLIGRKDADGIGDRIFNKLDNWTPSPIYKSTPRYFKPIADGNRRRKSIEEMAIEANKFREHFKFNPKFLPHTILKFGKHILDPRQVFFESKHTYCIVNISPLAPGHVLVISKKIVPQIRNLSSEEANDLWNTIVYCGENMKVIYPWAVGFQIGIQDGREASQSVPHVHVHVMPYKLNT